ncbi:MAG: hypothetical protein ACNA71_07615 [Kiritimatiellia bacterium]
MNFIAVKDLKTPRQVRASLQREGELLLMNNGKPMALLLDIGPDDDALALVESTREARSRLALSRVREAARQSGAALMTPEEIEREIAQARVERRRRQ